MTVNEKQTELNGYYLLYNTLEDTKVYLNKELSLLTSIHDSFSQSMTSSAGKGEFLQQMEKIVTAVRQNKNKVWLFIRKFVNNFLFNNSHFFFRARVVFYSGSSDREADRNVDGETPRSGPLPWPVCRRGAPIPRHAQGHQPRESQV